MGLPRAGWMRTQLAADALLLFNTVVWGATFPMVKDAMRLMDVYVFLAQRFFLAAFLLLPVAFLRPWPSRDTLRSGSLLGFFLFLGFALQTEGLKLTTASNTAFLTGLNAAFVPLLGFLFFKRHPSKRVLCGAVLALAGLYVLSGMGGFGSGTGDLLVVGCAACIALHILLTGRFAVAHDPVWLTVVQLTMVGCLSAILAGMRGLNPWVYTPGAVVTLLVCAVLASSVAFLIQTAMQRITTPTRTAIIFCMEPVFGGVFAYLLLGEGFGAYGMVGAALVVAGMVLSSLPERT